MSGKLSGVRVLEVGGAAAMPYVGMIMGSWGADVIHVEPPEGGDIARHLLEQGMSGWIRPHPVNHLWEHVGRNKRGISVDLRKEEGRKIIYNLIRSTDVFMNNLRPYEMEKFELDYDSVRKVNDKIVYANLTGYGLQGPEKNSGGYDSVAFWARSGVMDLMHNEGAAPNISRPSYGDSIAGLNLLAGVMAALFIREKYGISQMVEVSLFNTGVWVLGFDMSSCLIEGIDALRPERKTMMNPLRNVYGTTDGRWIMLGMTNAQHYWKTFCEVIGKPDLENAPDFATYDMRAKHSQELVNILDEVFKAKTFGEWFEILSKSKLIWSPVASPMEVTNDQQALANGFFVEWDHPKYGVIRVLNNPIKLSETKAEITRPAPELGEHTYEVLAEIGYSHDDIENMMKSGVIGSQCK